MPWRIAGNWRRRLRSLTLRFMDFVRPTRLVPLSFVTGRGHYETVIVDGALLYLGSANWTGAGLGAKGTGRRNFEIGIVTDDALLLDDVQELFDRVWRGAECGACRLRDECPRPLDLAPRVSKTRPRAAAAGFRAARRDPRP